VSGVMRTGKHFMSRRRATFGHWRGLEEAGVFTICPIRVSKVDEETMKRTISNPR
jgi:hypothetical protein